MSRLKKTHICAITDSDASESLLPAVHPLAPLSIRLKRFLKKQLLVSEYHPKTLAFFLTSARVLKEKKQQVESGSWIVHPFSVFRLYYEMWMGAVFFVNLIFNPLDAAFGFLLRTNLVVGFILNAFCLFDVFMNFRTGYRLPSNEVEMTQKKIAKHYVFGIYFVCDFLSSLPYHAFAEDRVYSNCFSFLKIVRLVTLLSYMERSFSFFNIRSFYIRLVTLMVLIIHYVACFGFYLPLLMMRLTEGVAKRDKFLIRELGTRKPNITTFTKAYITNCYASTAFLLSSTFLAPFIQIILLDRYRLYKNVETKFYELISQVDAFMEIHNFPFKLQKRVHQYYKYKYRMKYFDESRFDDNIPESLQSEIRSHQLRSLIKNVTIFAAIPPEVLEKVFAHLKKEIYLPQDVIIRADVTGDSMFFIDSGTVAVFSPTGKEVCHLSDGDYFGEIALVFPNRKTSANIIALEICEVYKLDRKSFKKCLESQTDLYKRIQLEAQRRLKETHQIHRKQILVTPTYPQVL